MCCLPTIRLLSMLLIQPAQLCAWYRILLVFIIVSPSENISSCPAIVGRLAPLPKATVWLVCRQMSQCTRARHLIPSFLVLEHIVCG